MNVSHNTHESGNPSDESVAPLSEEARGSVPAGQDVVAADAIGLSSPVAEEEEDDGTPAELAELARRHPAAVLIGAHTGSDWEIGIRAVRDCKNVSVDLSGFDPTAGVTEMAVRELGAERVLFGSDAGGRSFASQLGKVVGADIPDLAKKLILGENLKRLLMPILKQKGVRV